MQELGINPAHFNGVQEVYLADGSTLMPLDNAQNDVWIQYAWQNADQISRDELATEIAKAEEDVTAYLGFFPAPDWIVEQQHDFSYYHRRDSNIISHDIRYGKRGVILKNGHYIASGKRKVTLIENVRITFDDLDGDGFDEIAIVNTINVTPGMTLDKIKVYAPGLLAERTYELREPISTTLSGTTFTARYYTWQVINPDIYEELPDNASRAKSIDISDATNLLSHADVYYEENDETDNSAKFIHVVDGLIAHEDGMFYMQDYSSNYAIPVIADYNSSTGAWEIASCGESHEHVLLSYYSGFVDPRYTPRIASDKLNNDFAKAIAYIATSRLERVFYANNNATALATNLMEDLITRTREGTRFPTADIISCPFGTRNGEVLDYRILKRYHARRLGTAVLCEKKCG